MPFKTSERRRQWGRANYQKHREHFKAKTRAYYHTRTQETRDYLLRKKFGITLEQYNRMWKARQGLCDNCGKPETNGKLLAVDHDHSTQEIRGMLCHACNCSLGLMGEDTDKIAGLIRYLKFFQQRTSLGSM